MMTNQAEFVMTDARREYLNKLVASRLAARCGIMMNDKGYTKNYVDDFIRRSVFMLSYVMGDTNFDNPFEEISLKIAMVNTLLDNSHRIDHNELINQLMRIS